MRHSGGICVSTGRCGSSGRYGSGYSGVSDGRCGNVGSGAPSSAPYSLNFPFRNSLISRMPKLYSMFCSSLLIEMKFKQIFMTGDATQNPHL